MTWNILSLRPLFVPPRYVSHGQRGPSRHVGHNVSHRSRVRGRNIEPCLPLLQPYSRNRGATSGGGVSHDCELVRIMYFKAVTISRRTPGISERCGSVTIGFSADRHLLNSNVRPRFLATACLSKQQEHQGSASKGQMSQLGQFHVGIMRGPAIRDIFAQYRIMPSTSYPVLKASYFRRGLPETQTFAPS